MATVISNKQIVNFALPFAVQESVNFFVTIDALQTGAADRAKRRDALTMREAGASKENADALLAIWLGWFGFADLNCLVCQ